MPRQNATLHALNERISNIVKLRSELNSQLVALEALRTDLQAMSAKRRRTRPARQQLVNATTTVPTTALPDGPATTTTA